jgi:hypothetical protein
VPWERRCATGSVHWSGSSAPPPSLSPPLPGTTTAGSGSDNRAGEGGGGGDGAGKGGGVGEVVVGGGSGGGGGGEGCPAAGAAFGSRAGAACELEVGAMTRSWSPGIRCGGTVATICAKPTEAGPVSSICCPGRTLGGTVTSTESYGGGGGALRAPAGGPSI